MLKQKLIDTICECGTWRGSTRANKRRRLLEDMGFRIGGKAEHVIITGCDPPDTVPDAFLAFKHLLDYLKIDHTLLEKPYCCAWGPLGRPAAVAKNEEDRARSRELSRESVIENYRQAEALGAKYITVFCAACEPAYTNNAGETSLEILSFSDLLDRYYPGGKLNMEIDYYPGCYRFRRRAADKPLDLGAAQRLLNKIEGLRVNHLDSSLCCYIPPHFDQLAESITSKTVVTLCVACTTNIAQKLRDRGDYQVKMLPEILWEALQNK
jgi:Fe-S oxidoreductase